MASLDSEGFCQVIATKLGLKQEDVVCGLIINTDDPISSMEEFCCLKEKELDERLPNLTCKQKRLFRLLKNKFWKESPTAAADADLTQMAQMSISLKGSHHSKAHLALRCTQRGSYQWPWKVKRQDEEHHFIHYEVSSHEDAYAEKVILFVGAAGSGMELLLDFISTIIYGYSEEHNCQVSLFPKHSADDEVMPITAYTFPSLCHPYALTIVTVPAVRFADEVSPAMSSTTNDCLLDSIKSILFGLNYIDRLHGIAFVTNASKNAITPAEQGILESMRCIFGDDMHRNLFILNTFADSRQPNAVTALRRAGIPFNEAFQFNCSPLLPPVGDCGFAEFDKLNWQMSEQSVTAFLQLVAEIPRVNLQSTCTTAENL